MLDLFRSYPSVTAISKSLQGEHSLLFERLWDTPKALLALLLQEMGKNVLIITGGERETRLYDDLCFFATASSIL